MFTESAHLYDAIYRAFKDYAAEATAISTLVRAAHPSATTILDEVGHPYDVVGTRTAREVHELGLFTPEEMLACFRDAGLEATYDAKGLTGRGLYVARDGS